MMTISLNAEGFTLSLRQSPGSGHFGSPFFEGTLLLRSTVPGVAHTFQTRGVFPLSDLARLGAWMQAHIQSLSPASSEHPQVSVETDTWVSLDLSVQIQCLDGDVEQQDGTFVGGFGLRVLVQIGEDAATGHAVYGGFEGGVDVSEAVTFCRHLADWIAPG